MVLVRSDLADQSKRTGVKEERTSDPTFWRLVDSKAMRRRYIEEGMEEDAQTLSRCNVDFGNSV